MALAVAAAHTVGLAVHLEVAVAVGLGSAVIMCATQANVQIVSHYVSRQVIMSLLHVQNAWQSMTVKLASTA
jgi:hypothetical protein